MVNALFFKDDFENKKLIDGLYVSCYDRLLYATSTSTTNYYMNKKKIKNKIIKLLKEYSEKKWWQRKKHILKSALCYIDRLKTS